jgi:hypothetical protein
MPSDAFGPGEVVILYALVSDGVMSLQNLLVSFYMHSHDGTSFTLTAETNASELAKINFVIPKKC